MNDLHTGGDTVTDPHKQQYVLACKNAETKHEVRILSCRRRSGVNITVIATVLLFYVAGLLLITQPRLLVALAGVIPLTIAMIISWYLTHECAHLSVFARRKYNHWLGESLSWVNGLPYFRFGDYSKNHLRHHSERVDLVGTDLRAMLAGFPTWWAHTLLLAEGFYIPILNVLIKLDGIYTILHGTDNGYRRRVRLALFASTSFLLALAAHNWYAPWLYLVAATIRIHCVRFVDAFQHSYARIDPSQRGARTGRYYEQHNTFSFPVARHFRLLNLLILNFGYHNAHHAMPACPWYHLPRLNQLLMAGSEGESSKVVSPGAGHVRFRELLRTYHKYRKHRILAADEGQAYDEDHRFSMTRFTGAFTDNLLG